MRYYWGYGVGHTYAHHSRNKETQAQESQGIPEGMHVNISAFLSSCIASLTRTLPQNQEVAVALLVLAMVPTVMPVRYHETYDLSTFVE